ncbi:MAG TPA: hypothetical protein VKR54_03505 [Candidatus Babeliales bacterium]|jgi:hypothetical protein|nr:hypothetical protein [Candidatus Babeliales bacterium]
MKFFKNTIAILALFAIGSIFGKAIAPRGGSKPAAQSAAQKEKSTSEMVKPSTEKSYAVLLAEIKKMRPAAIIDNAGKLQQTFMDFVTINDLSPIENKSLFQAGINMHTTWTTDNQKNKEKLSNLTRQIPVEELPEEKGFIMSNPSFVEPTKRKNPAFQQKMNAEQERLMKVRAENA